MVYNYILKVSEMFSKKRIIFLYYFICWLVKGGGWSNLPACFGGLL